MDVGLIGEQRCEEGRKEASRQSTYEASSGVRSLPFRGPECGGVSDMVETSRSCLGSPKAFREFTSVCPLEACSAERQLLGRLVEDVSNGLQRANQAMARQASSPWCLGTETPKSRGWH
jgi:hypothetical protein